MSDTTDSTDQMQSTPDAGGRGQLVKDGGDATILLHEGTGLESTLGNDGISPDPENSVNTVFKRVIQWVKASISLLANQRTQIRDHKKKTISNAIDGKIGHIGNEFGMASRREGCTGWCHDDVGTTTVNLSALLKDKGASAKLGLLC